MKYNYRYKNEAGQYAPKMLTINGRLVINPTAEMYASQGYLPYTPPQPSEEEVAEQERLARIDELKALLADSDYKAIKFAEGWLTAEEYAETKAQRQEWRDAINQLDVPHEDVVSDFEEIDAIVEEEGGEDETEY